MYLLLWHICLYIPHKSPAPRVSTAQMADGGFIVRAPGLTSRTGPSYQVTTARTQDLESLFAILPAGLKIASLLCAYLGLSGGYCRRHLCHADSEYGCITCPQNITPHKITVRTLWCFHKKRQQLLHPHYLGKFIVSAPRFSTKVRRHLIC